MLVESIKTTGTPLISLNSVHTLTAAVIVIAVATGLLSSNYTHLLRALDFMLTVPMLCCSFDAQHTVILNFERHYDMEYINKKSSIRNHITKLFVVIIRTAVGTIDLSSILFSILVARCRQYSHSCSSCLPRPRSAAPLEFLREAPPNGTARRPYSGSISFVKKLNPHRILAYS